MMSYSLPKAHVAVVGLGYVGMPLALVLANHMKVSGFDILDARINELRDGFDRNCEIEELLLRSTTCYFTNDIEDIRACNVYIITVPTPIDDQNRPDLRPVESATRVVSSLLKKGDIVVYESTVYPGVTEDFCGPLLEAGSGLKCGEHFFLGYSPERINPGDAAHTVQKITKVVAGQTDAVTDFLAELYGTMNNGNIFRARDIRTAEASKAIENAQRDVNVAFINEITMILNKLGLSSHDVLEAAGTKWNFLKFSPGLVGGHCIGVDPYYLAECAVNIGHEPRIILAGREINDSMGYYVADCINNLLVKNKENAGQCRILLLGFTFKENINDIRNTKVIDIVNALQTQGHHVDVHDPHARSQDVEHEYNIQILNTLPSGSSYDSVALLVGHDIYRDFTSETLQSFLKPQGIVYDMKGLWRSRAHELSQRFLYCTL